MKKSKFFIISLIVVELLVISMLLNEILNKKNLDFLLIEISNEMLPEKVNLCTIPSNNSRILEVLQSNCSTYFHGTSCKIPPTFIKINSDGFRDKEYKIEKPNNTFRIIILGDSYTFGNGVNIFDAYTEVLERKLNSLNNDVNYEVLNFGVPGFNTLEEVEFFKLKALKYNPNMVMVAYMDNDILNKTSFVEIREEVKLKYRKLGYDTHQPHWSIKIQEEATKLAFNELENKPFEKVWKNVEQPLSDLHDITSQRNISFIVFYVGLYTAPQHYKFLKNTAEKHGWYFIESMKGSSRNELIIDPKCDPHPNKKGHELIAEKIYNFLLEKKLI